MSSNNYSSASRLLHQNYLNNYLVSKTSFDLEKLIYLKKAQENILNEVVFVTGLARAGTTALFNALFNTGSFASLTYANMPFLLMPNLAKLFYNTPPSTLVERAHKDGLMINNKSPEAFDEFFWKVFLNNKYIEADKLVPHFVDDAIIEEYKKYIQLVAYGCQCAGYLSKNNNNILRVNSLLKAFPEAKFIVLYRDPLTHARSLFKQHINFSALQQREPFAVNYFNYLGHHEFGLNHKPFVFDASQDVQENADDINYWLKNWYNYYTFLLANYNERLRLVAFEDLCEKPALIADYLNSQVKLKTPVVITEKHVPKPVSAIEYDAGIYNKCMGIYTILNSKRNYGIDSRKLK